MKRFLSPVVAITAIAVIASLGVAQQDQHKSSARAADKQKGIIDIRKMTGKVTQVDEKAKTFTLEAQGKQYNFVVAKWPVSEGAAGIGPPKVGAVIDVTYTGTPGGPKPLEASNLNLSKSNIN